MKINNSNDFSITFLSNFIFGTIFGVIYMLSSKISGVSSLIYMVLGLTIFFRFYIIKFNISNFLFILSLLTLWILMWYSSLIFNPNDTIIMWKISVGMMWLLIIIIFLCDCKLHKEKFFYWFVYGFGISLIIMTIIGYQISTVQRLSFIGDPKAPHVYASCLILTGAAILSPILYINSKKYKVIELIGILLIFLSMLTLSKTAFLASIILTFFLLFRYPILVSSLLIVIYIFFISYDVDMSKRIFFRLYTFKTTDVSIFLRFNLLLDTISASLNYGGISGYVGYPKRWIDTGIGSMISSFGVIGTLPLGLMLFRFFKFNVLSFGAILLLFIFLVTEHLILPRILLPFILIIYAINLQSYKVSKNKNKSFHT